MLVIMRRQTGVSSFLVHVFGGDYACMMLNGRRSMTYAHMFLFDQKGTRMRMHIVNEYSSQ